MDEIQQQRDYYTETANQYDQWHANSHHEEHFLALSFLAASLDYLKVRSVLDIGSGTGRVISYIKQHSPQVRVMGVEPVKELREVGYAQGISRDELVDGDATKLPYDAAEFDLVCGFGVLHHIRKPELAVSEMLRISGKAIFISDANNFGQGSFLSRFVKQTIHFLKLWSLAKTMQTRGKNYTVSESDGVAYSYSVFNNFKQIKARCKSVHLLNTKDAHFNLYRTASHVALLGIKK
jgi:ubiquinone/menaquinone biosynthesis C-methylase UbiE